MDVCEASVVWDGREEVRREMKEARSKKLDIEYVVDVSKRGFLKLRRSEIFIAWNKILE